MVTEIHERVAPTLGHRHKPAAAKSLPWQDAEAPATSFHPVRRRAIKRFGRRLFSRLIVVTVAANIPALGILLGGVLFFSQYRDGLVDSKIESLKTQGKMIAGALEEAATKGEALALGQEQFDAPLVREGEMLEIRIDPELAGEVIARLTAPIATRARLFVCDCPPAGDGELVVDTQRAIDVVEVQELPNPRYFGFDDALRGAFRWMMRVSLSQPQLSHYRDPPKQKAHHYGEVMQALKGEPADARRRMAGGETIVSVAIPVQRFKQVLGVLLLSSAASEVDEEVTKVHIAFLQIFGIALVVSILLSVYLARTITRPIRRLTQAAGKAEYRTGSRNVIPDFTSRADEIGDLSEALRAMTDALYERLDNAGSFADEIAHEIKNPLSSIQSAAEMLSRTKDPAKWDELLRVIPEDVHRIERRLNDISNEARLGVELARGERTLVDLLDVANELARVHRSKGVGVQELEVRPIGVGPFRVLCNGDQIGQLLEKLLDNAASFSPPGGRIVIELRCFDGLVEVAVEDEGRGIPEDKREEVFNRFYTDRPTGEPFGKHSGLGLTIAKKIVDAHGGSIRVQNRRGPDGNVQGARFLTTFSAA